MLLANTQAVHRTKRLSFAGTHTCSGRRPTCSGENQDRQQMPVGAPISSAEYQLNS